MSIFALPSLINIYLAASDDDVHLNFHEISLIQKTFNTHIDVYNIKNRKYEKHIHYTHILF